MYMPRKILKYGYKFQGTDLCNQDVSQMQRPTQKQEDFYNQLYTRKIIPT